MKCPFCNKQPSYYSKKSEIRRYIYRIFGINPFFRCRHCNVVVFLDRKDKKRITDICLYYPPFYIRIDYDIKITSLWKFDKKNIYSNKNMLIATSNSNEITHFNYIIDVSPTTLNQKIKTILSLL